MTFGLRQIKAIAFATVAGVALCVALAALGYVWSLGASNRGAGSSRSYELTPTRDNVGGVWIGRANSDFARTRAFQMRFFSDDPFLKALVPSASSTEPAPWWSMMGSGRFPPSMDQPCRACFQERSETVYGWPMAIVMSRVETDWVPTGLPEPPVTLHGEVPNTHRRVPIVTAGIQGYSAENPIPTRVLWTGLLANSAVFAFSLLIARKALWIAVAWIARRMRPDTTKCHRCGYSRIGIATEAVCPECGGEPRIGVAVNFSNES